MKNLIISIIALIIGTLLIGAMFNQYEVERCNYLKWEAQQGYPNHYITENWKKTCDHHNIKVETEVKPNS